MAASNPETQPFSINYDGANTDQSVIASHTISYTVTNTIYSNLVQVLNGSFVVTIACPAQVKSSEVTTQTADQAYTLNLMNTVSITAPIVTYDPISCFTIQTFVMEKESGGGSVASWL